MALSKLPKNSKIDKVDHRCTLYYGKYNYRARFSLEGLQSTYYAKDFLGFLGVIARRKESIRNVASGRYNIMHHTRVLNEIESIDLDAIERFIDWRNRNTKGKDKQAMLRVEGKVAGVFSNDLQLLTTLENLTPGLVVDYTEIDQSIPQGVKYYVNKPKHNYRVYLRSKRVDEKIKEDLSRFVDRYKNTETVIVPSNAFKLWLNPIQNKWLWNTNYLSSHYYLDFDQESTDTLFSLMFGNLIGKRYKLEKQP